MSGDQLIQSICDQNLAVYRASVTRLQEDVGQEAEIAHDYRGRIVYELLQNADDAMSGAPSHQDAVYINLTETDLWFGNSGRPLDEDDVRGLCGIGASSKGAAVGRRRASIGHKGMGFKSVLEITEAPEVHSETYSFRLGRQLARGPVQALMGELGQPVEQPVPVMRFPAALSAQPDEWQQASDSGVRTLFRFPLRPDIDAKRHAQLAERLIGLPVTAILFLKHLERIDVRVTTAEGEDHLAWEVTRERHSADGWSAVPGLSKPGIYRVTVRRSGSEKQEERRFLVAHNDALEIGDHRGGLDAYAWAGVELSEVAVAAELNEVHAPITLDQASQVLHVFLPTSEQCPYPLLINGAFSADLSRQEVRVSDDPSDYNRWLLSQAARVFGDVLVPALKDLGASDASVLQLLDRGCDTPNEPAGTRTAQAIVEAMREAFAIRPVVSLLSGDRVPAAACCVPPLVDDEQAGAAFRELLGDETPSMGSYKMPPAAVCGGRAAVALVDHGAYALEPDEAPLFLSSSDLTHLRLRDHESGGFSVDPVLAVLERLWEGLPPAGRGEFQDAVRHAVLLPVAQAQDGRIERVAVGEHDCFYPPRALSGSVPLEGLCFIAREVCWGALLPKERQEYLRDQMASWQALFGVRDFKFPDVMRSSVLPALTLPDDGGRTEQWHELRSPVVLAAICQLSGRTPNPAAPLPYERLGPNRALFNLSRLPVPCKTEVEGEYTWEPAYKVYFGEDWIGDASVEHVLSAIERTAGGAPQVPMLVPPKEIVPLLDRYKHLRGAADEDDEDPDADDEVELDEDEEAALDGSDQDRWLSFLTWLGVNRALRPTHFTDVEDRGARWLTTKGLSKPQGWAFRDLPDELWQPFEAAARSRLAPDELQDHDTYFYAAHDLEYAAEILGHASQDADCDVARALFVHLVENWPQLQRFARMEVAVVAAGVSPGRRAVPRAHDSERRELGENFWLWRLKNRDFCPTSRGPKRPADTWVRTRELDRRFSSTRGNIDCTHLLPVLDIPESIATRARPLQVALGVREEITPSSLRPEDARSILTQLERLYRDGPRRSAIREVIRPAYRSLIELLPGQAGDRRFPPGILSDAPLLETDGHDGYRFATAARVLWAERNGTRERLGNPSELWTFVHEASSSARVPLTELFDVRVLEEHLVWSPVPGAEALDEAELHDFRQGLAEVAPYILSRLGADRTAEALQRQDAATLRRLTHVLTPVDALRVSCTLDGQVVAQRGDRAAFVDLQGEGGTRAFVRWGDCGWPPSPVEAEALATALSEALGATNFEAFFALINAQDAATRSRMLSLAGAPNDLDGARAALADQHSADPGPDPGGAEPELEKEAGQSTDEAPPQPPGQAESPSSQPMTPLYGAHQLLVDGIPVVVSGEREHKTESSGARRRGARGAGGTNGGGYGGRTDLSELDRLGMFIAMTFERNRLVQAGTAAECFEPDSNANQPNARVFDVSSPARIERARECSQAFANALDYITARGVDSGHPGCDIISLGTSPETPVDRLIELKSSGVHARTQAMTWNEWKTATSDALRKHFYLYLVGNLRSDLPDARPFLRAVRDPYESMRTREHVDIEQTRRVVLYVAEFDQAEELMLGVKPAS